MLTEEGCKCRNRRRWLVEETGIQKLGGEQRKVRQECGTVAENRQYPVEKEKKVIKMRGGLRAIEQVFLKTLQCELREGLQRDPVGYLQIVRALQPLLGCLGNLVGPGM